MSVVLDTPRSATKTPTPVLSAELFVIPLEDDRFLIYAPLRRAAFVASARLVNLLADLKEGRFDACDDPDGAIVEFLRRLEIIDGAPETPPVTNFEGNPLPTTVTLFLTTACNLRCTYCYASAGDTPLRSMSLETARRGIDFVAANAVKKGVSAFEVAYHGGGEPTANWRVMTESYAYAETTAARLGLHFTAACATNGVLRDEQIDWIVEHLESVSLSFDGSPEAHDKHRLTVLGGGSSDRVMHTMRRFDAAGFPYGVRVTVTRDQIARLPESVAYLCAHFHPVRIQVEPAYQLGRWSHAPSAETEEFVAAFREAQARAMEHGREIVYSAARLDTLTNHFCGVTQDSFALSPDGNVSGCYEVFSEASPLADVFFYGKPDSGGGYTFNLPVLNHLRGQAVQDREYCRGCFAKWHCAGDCYHKALTVNGRGEFAGSDRCHITRELTKDQVLARIAAVGGLFWHEPPTEGAQRPSQGKELLG
jgi:uncharacterized protein